MTHEGNIRRDLDSDRRYCDILFFSSSLLLFFLPSSLLSSFSFPPPSSSLSSYLPPLLLLSTPSTDQSYCLICTSQQLRQADPAIYFLCKFCINIALVLVLLQKNLSWYILLLLKSLPHSLAVLQELLRALGNARGLLGSQVGRGEVVDAVVETSGHQVGVQAHEILHLLLLHDLLELLLFLDVQLVHFVWGSVWRRMLDCC